MLMSLVTSSWWPGKTENMAEEQSSSGSSSNVEQSSSGEENEDSNCMNVEEQKGTIPYRFEPHRARLKRATATPVRVDRVRKSDWYGTFFIVTSKKVTKYAFTVIVLELI